MAEPNTSVGTVKTMMCARPSPPQNYQTTHVMTPWDGVTRKSPAQTYLDKTNYGSPYDTFHHNAAASVFDAATLASNLNAPKAVSNTAVAAGKAVLTNKKTGEVVIAALQLLSTAEKETLKHLKDLPKGFSSTAPASQGAKLKEAVEAAKRYETHLNNFPTTTIPK